MVDAVCFGRTTVAAFEPEFEEPWGWLRPLLLLVDLKEPLPTALVLAMPTMQSKLLVDSQKQQQPSL